MYNWLSLFQVIHLSATTKFWVSCDSLQHRKIAVRRYKVARLPQCQKLNVRHVHFLSDFCAISGGRTAAVWHAGLLHTQVSCKTAARQARVFVRLTSEFSTHAFVIRKSYDWRKITVRFIARLPQECFETNDRLALSCVSVEKFARPACVSLACEREIIIRTSYCCLTFCVILSKFVCDLPHGLYVLSLAAKSHEQTAVRLMWNRLYL